MFNNGATGAGQSGGGSKAIEIQLDQTAKTATKLWEYQPTNPTINNAIMGDVQRLANGNTLVTFSTQGVIHEVDASGALVQSLSFGTSGATGYVIKRPTMYGPAPK
jgi:hypothetical protein